MLLLSGHRSPPSKRPLGVVSELSPACRVSVNPERIPASSAGFPYVFSAFPLPVLLPSPSPAPVNVLDCFPSFFSPGGTANGNVQSDQKAGSLKAWQRRDRLAKRLDTAEAWNRARARAKAREDAKHILSGLPERAHSSGHRTFPSGMRWLAGSQWDNRLSRCYTGRHLFRGGASG